MQNVKLKINLFAKFTIPFAMDKIANQEKRQCRQQTRGQERKAS
jgi:hypothetical protein